jgi:hypothetical protein
MIEGISAVTLGTHEMPRAVRSATVPHDAEWGERFFYLIDPDGHELSFARALLPVSVQ